MVVARGLVPLGSNGLRPPRPRRDELCMPWFYPDDQRRLRRHAEFLMHNLRRHAAGLRSAGPRHGTSCDREARPGRRSCRILVGSPADPPVVHTRQWHPTGHHGHSARHGRQSALERVGGHPGIRASHSRDRILRRHDYPLWTFASRVRRCAAQFRCADRRGHRRGLRRARPARRERHGPRRSCRWRGWSHRG